MSNRTGNAPFSLPLYGAAALLHQGTPVAVRTKGLALLYFLALEGSARREELADLLWGHPASAQNLRVELHRLRQTLGGLGYKVFQANQNPLSLPLPVVLDERPAHGQLLEGLEGLSSGFDNWLTSLRSRRQQPLQTWVSHHSLVEQVTPEITVPYLLIIRRKPGLGIDAFVRSLADAKELPYVEGLSGPERAVHFITPPYPENCVRVILSRRRGVFVMEVPAYGEDPVVLLELRNHWPAEQMRYLVLPTLGWLEAKGESLESLGFSEAARVYLATGGAPDYMAELLELRPENGFGSELPVPQRIRSAYQLEARHASLDARLALERLSVHPGALSSGLIGAFGAKPHLDELERRGWLTLDHAWRFADEVARRVIYSTLQPGRRKQYHREAALQMAVENNFISDIYHRLQAGDEVDWDTAWVSLRGFAREELLAWLGMHQTGESVAVHPVGAGSELALLQEYSFGQGLSPGERLTFNPTPNDTEPSGVVFELPDEPVLIHLKGQGYVENALGGVGLSGEAIPLVIQVEGVPKALLLTLTTRAILRPEGLVLPLSESFDYWVVLPKGRKLRVTSQAEAAVIELELSVHRAEPVGPKRTARVVQAYDLSDQRIFKL